MQIKDGHISSTNEVICSGRIEEVRVIGRSKCSYLGLEKDCMRLVVFTNQMLDLGYKAGLAGYFLVGNGGP